MSIKKLFDTKDRKNFSDYSNKKEKFEFVESAENAKQLSIKKQTFVPQLDYSRPENFIKFSSAELFYKGVLEKISGYYPYDGSGAEKNKFYNELLEGEKYIFDNLYPTSTGYGLLSADGWGSQTSITDGYGLPASLEYITFKGGPLTASLGSSLVAQGPDPSSGKFQYGTVYDENIYQTAGLPNSYGKGTRLSNLRSDFDDGVTVEFWLKKAAFGGGSTTQREVILDVWNNQTASGLDYGRITIELDQTVGASATPFKLTVQSGSAPSGIFRAAIGDSTVTKASLTSWTHFAFTLYNTGSSFYTKMYKNGELNDFNVYSTTISELNSKGMMGRIGALLTAPSGSGASIGSGKLSASVDEFRFWKVARNSQQINRNWFTNVDGGANSDISNTTLGIYYKFNEGIVNTSSIDSLVLDYAGRLSNGVWTGYDSYSRSICICRVLNCGRRSARSNYKNTTCKISKS
jgi:hypothetical protein